MASFFFGVDEKESRSPSKLKTLLSSLGACEAVPFFAIAILSDEMRDPLDIRWKKTELSREDFEGQRDES